MAAGDVQLPRPQNVRAGVVSSRPAGCPSLSRFFPSALLLLETRGSRDRKTPFLTCVCGCPRSVLSISPSSARPAVRCRTCGLREAQPGPGAVSRRSGEAADALSGVARSGLPCLVRSTSVGRSVTVRGPREPVRKSGKNVYEGRGCQSLQGAARCPVPQKRVPAKRLLTFTLWLFA